MIKRLCDVCGSEIITQDEYVQDTIDNEYPSRDICPDCYLNMKFTGVVAEKAFLEKTTPQEIVRRWLEKYE